jgi:hypothetical protein
MYDLEEKFEEIKKLRKNVDKNKYQALKKINTKDFLYGWAFENDDVLYDSIEDIRNCYENRYVNSLMLVYIEILNCCQKDNKN